MMGMAGPELGMSGFAGKLVTSGVWRAFGRECTAEVVRSESMKQRRRGRLLRPDVFLRLAVALVVSGVARGAEQDPALLELAKVQKMVRVGVCQWGVEATIPREGVPVFSEAQRAAVPEISCFTGRLKVWLGQNAAALEEKSATWDNDQNRFVPSSFHFWLRDDRVYRLSTDLNSGTVDAMPGGRPMSRLPASSRPAFLAYRLFDAAVGLAKPEQLAKIGMAVHQGRDCQVYEKRFAAQGWRWQISLAKNLGYRVVRYQTLMPSGKIDLDISLKYERDPDIEMRLGSWVIRRPWLGSTETGRLEHHQFNRPIDPEKLRPTFPSGTRVVDHVSGVRYIKGREAETFEFTRGAAAGAKNAAGWRGSGLQ